MNSVCRSVRYGLIAILLVTASWVSASDSDTTVRHEFKQAYIAINSMADQHDSATLRSYILYPYLQAARLRFALSQTGVDAVAVEERVSAFLREHQGQPVTRGLRRDWLQHLARHQQWTTFLANYQPDTNDVELTCWHASALLAKPVTTDEAALLRESLLTLWLRPKRFPEACNEAFDWATSHHWLSAGLIEQRAKLVLQAGQTDFARELVQSLSAEQSEALRFWADLIDKPQAAFDRLIATPSIRVEETVLQDAWLRFARKDPSGALTRFAPLMKSRGYSVQTASPYALSLALSLSWSRRSEALTYFAQVFPTDKTDQGYEWHARAALWAGDWSQVIQVISEMPVSLKSQARWRYWLARALQQNDQQVLAHSLFQNLVANDDNYYAALAAARLGVRYVPHGHPLTIDQADLQQLSVLPIMQRIRELVAVNLRSEALQEWDAAMSGLPSSQQAAAAKLVSSWGWHEQAIMVTARLGQYNDYDMLYPRPYDGPVDKAVRASGLSADLVYGQMRQESLFRADAVSVANARGLLQLLPTTARTTAKQFNLPTPNEVDLFNPDINVSLGALHLKLLERDFGGQTMMALAAYNAGTAAVRRWLPAHAMDADIWVENIPYNETRNYVQRIFWHSLVYGWLRTGEPVDTQAWLMRIGGDTQ